jgi:hypothetical protein
MPPSRRRCCCGCVDTGVPVSSDVAPPSPPRGRNRHRSVVRRVRRPAAGHAGIEVVHARIRSSDWSRGRPRLTWRLPGLAVAAPEDVKQPLKRVQRREIQRPRRPWPVISLGARLARLLAYLGPSATLRLDSHVARSAALRGIRGRVGRIQKPSASNWDHDSFAALPRHRRGVSIAPLTLQSQHN